MLIWCQQSFIAQFVKHIRESEGGQSRAFCVGEFWKGKTIDSACCLLKLMIEDSVDTLARTSRALGLNSHALIRVCRVSTEYMISGFITC